MKKRRVNASLKKGIRRSYTSGINNTQSRKIIKNLFQKNASKGIGKAFSVTKKILKIKTQINCFDFRPSELGKENGKPITINSVRGVTSIRGKGSMKRIKDLKILSCRNQDRSMRNRFKQMFGKSSREKPTKIKLKYLRNFVGSKYFQD